MKTVILIITLCLSMLRGYGQGENNIWTIDAMNTRLAVLDFNASPAPQVNALPQGSIGGTNWSSAVCRPNGTLRFYIRLSDNIASWSALNIYLPNGTAIPNSNLATGMLTENCQPVVVPHPGNPDQYYIFYTKNNGLMYALLDMSLNSGQGGMVQKDVLISGYGTVVATKMTAIRGCDGVWLVIRQRTANGFKSYHIGRSGINSIAVISQVGTFQDLNEYNYYAGFLKSSGDGTKLVLTCWRGVELYKFEKCSGKVSDAMALDTTGNIAFSWSAPAAPYYSFYEGVAFSPDNSKLYVTLNTKQTSGSFHGQLYQFDLSLGSTSAIAASKTLIIDNLPSLVEDISALCIGVVVNPMHSVKLGVDGKIYTDNGCYTCLPPSLVPPGYNTGPGFHVIHNPNAAGLSCIAELNKVLLYPFTHNLGIDFTTLGANLQQDIVTASPAPDTLPARVFEQAVCFKDSIVLKAKEGNCYLWDDGSTGITRTVYLPGIYYVHFFKDCAVQTDTYKVSFVKIPLLSDSGHSCPGKKDGILSIHNVPGDTTIFHFRWRDERGNELRESTASNGDTLIGLPAGTYAVSITTQSGCDTTLGAAVTLLPSPVVQIAPSDTIIKYGDAITLHASGAMYYQWMPDGSLNNIAGPSPVAKPLTDVVYTVSGWNEWGCNSKASAKVTVDYDMPDFVPSAFTPNGDGINDVFRIVGLTYQKLLVFDVFNRFGERIFSTNDAGIGWDGTYRGKPCELGTYYYYISLGYPDGKIKTIKGNVTLIR